MFYMSSMLFLLMIGVIWLSKPKLGAVAGGAGAH
jgi:DHA2 family multidrug resistance protein